MAFIEFHDVGKTYRTGEVEINALHDVNFYAERGEFIGLIGHTGSGKSTLIQHLNGLLKPNGGEILYNGENIMRGLHRA